MINVWRQCGFRPPKVHGVPMHDFIEGLQAVTFKGLEGTWGIVSYDLEARAHVVPRLKLDMICIGDDDAGLIGVNRNHALEHATPAVQEALKALWELDDVARGQGQEAIAELDVVDGKPRFRVRLKDLTKEE